MQKNWLVPLAALCAIGAAPAYARPAPTKAETEKAADAMVAAWQSMDAAKIKALYAPTVVGFDMTVAPLSTDRATWDKYQDAFAAAKIDHATQRARTIQILGADTFVVSGSWDVWSSTIAANKFTVRCTDVFQRTGSGWLIANEHCSTAPTA